MKWGRRLSVFIIAIVLLFVFVSYNYPSTDSNNKHQYMHSGVHSHQRYAGDAANRKNNLSCEPSTTIVFLKTHKTGSSTTASIFQRFGFLRNLSFAVPKKSHVFSNTQRFTRSNVKLDKYDMLVNHARYNRKEMDAVMKPGAKYITIIRDPATQAESMFGYYGAFKYLHLRKDENSFGNFISRPQYYLNRFKQFKMREHLTNPSLFDLGLDPSRYSDPLKVQSFIEKISREFDLVLLNEYYNESLLLLKKLLCWDMDDIIYIIKSSRLTTLKFNLSNDSKQKARQWNSGDAKLYDFFNATFWKKVSEYGPDFQADLKLLEKKLNATFYECTIVDAKPAVYHRTYTFVRDPKTGRKCEIMLWSVARFTRKIQKSQAVLNKLES